MARRVIVDYFGRRQGSCGFRNPDEPLPHLFEKAEKYIYLAFQGEDAGNQAIHRIERTNTAAQAAAKVAEVADGGSETGATTGVKKVEFGWGTWKNRASLNYKPINGELSGVVEVDLDAPEPEKEEE